MKFQAGTTVFICAAMATGSAVQAVSFRNIDGSGNNLANPGWGQTDTQLLRLASPSYEDGISVPRGGDPSSLPSGRAISNAVSAQSASVPNSRHASDWIWQWGQFLDHDLDLTESASPSEPFNISVPTGDQFFDPFNTSTQEIGLNRSVHDTSTGTSITNPRQQINQITAYIDGSQVYGSDSTRATELRTPAILNDGKLKTSVGATGEDLLPFNTAGLHNAGGTGSDLFLAGDIRANEQVGLTAVHTLFVREHNRLADDIAQRLDAGDASLNQKLTDSGLSRGDFIYETARKTVSAQIQLITYNEFLPSLLGPDALATYSGYDDTVNAGISNEFSTAAFRFGHSMLPSEILRTHNDGTEATEENIALRDAFFSPDEIVDHGIESLLKGLATGQAQEVDTLIIDDVRNFLFGPPGAGGFDIAALDIQRVRDHGLPSLNEMRSALGLPIYDSFLSMTDGDVALANAFGSVYSSVNDVDLWIGGLSETHVNGGFIGETFQVILVDQFTRSRDGDRFFYLSELAHLEAVDPDFESTTLADIIRRNTEISDIQENVFFLSTSTQSAVPEPTTTLLAGMILGVLGLVTTRRRNDSNYSTR